MGEVTNQQASTAGSAALQAPLRQRGRSSVDFICHLVRGGARVRAAVNADIAAAVPDIDALPDDLDLRDRLMTDKMQASRAWRVSQLSNEYHAQMHGKVAQEAYEEISADLAQVLADALVNGPSTLQAADKGAAAPAYWDGVHFHRTTGGWDGHEVQGYIHGEIVHRRLVEALYPGGIFKQRREVAGLAPKDHYDRILDMGCSTGHFTCALQETYPGASITGVDLSLRTLEHAQRVANLNGWSWELYQRAAEDTGFADDSFDLVTSYILLHEMPADAIRQMFAEAYRVAAPGGDLLMADVTRYADLDKLAEWQADFGARFGGEPYWRESASLDLAQAAREAGFIDVAAEGLGPRKYPHVVKGRKPA